MKNRTVVTFLSISGYNRFRIIILILIVGFFCGTFVFVSTVHSAETGQFVVKAQMWRYASLCKFPDSTNRPSALRYEAGTSITVRGCSDLEKELGHPSAIRITLVNLGDSKVEVPIEGLNSVLLITKAGKNIPALALRHWQRNPIGSGYSAGHATEVSGKIVVIVEPQESCDLIFLFPSANPGDRIKIAGLEAVRISD